MWRFLWRTNWTLLNFKLRRVKIRWGVRFYSHSVPDAAQISQNKWKCHVLHLVVNIAGVCLFHYDLLQPWEHSSTHMVTSVFRVASNDIELCRIHQPALKKKQLNNGSRWKLFNPALTLAYKMTGLRYSRDLWWRMFRIMFSISKWRFSNITSGWALIYNVKLVSCWDRRSSGMLCTNDR